MSNQGWIKLHRKLLENAIFTSEKGLKVWVWCLLKANHQDQDVFSGRQKVHISTGQFIMGRNTAKEELKMAVGTIWFWLDQLERDKYVERKSTNKYTVVTVLNYNQYQETERRLNTDRTQIVQQIEPNNNDKNENNNKKVGIYTSIESLNSEDFTEIATKYQTTFEFVKNKYDDMVLFCGSKNKKYANYKLALMNWVKRDKPVNISKQFKLL